MSTIDPGTGQQHLIALLRSIRAKLAAEAAQTSAASPMTNSGATATATGATGATSGTGTAAGGGATPGGAAAYGAAACGAAAGGSTGSLGTQHGSQAGGVPVGQPVPVPGRLWAAVPPAGPHPPGVACIGQPGHPGHLDIPVVGGDHPDGDEVLRDLRNTLLRCLAEAGPPAQVAGRLRDILAQAQPQVLIPLPGSPEIQRDQLRAALDWLVGNLDRPQAVAAGCGQLGGVLREWGIGAQQAQLVGAALAEALRAGMGVAWSREYDTALRTTWRLVQHWLADGAAAAQWTPAVWTGVVVEHDRRCDDLAVIRIRPYLPYRFLPGQFTRVEVAQHPQVWRPYSLAGAPRFDNLLEIHVRAKAATTVSGSLVYDTRVGDRVRLLPAAGEMVIDPASERDLLMIAGDTGVAPFKSLLTELAVTADPRTATLFWGVRTLDDLYDVAELDAIARSCRRATVVPVVSDGEPGPYPSGLVTDAVAAYGQWSAADVRLAGPPVMVAATRAVLETLFGIDPARIRHDPASL